MMQDFEALSARIASQTVLCIGDLMLDDFVYGEVSRISPEAPAPVIAVSRSEIVIGGAGNVARNIASLGARCIFVGLIGTDEAAHTLSSALSHEPRIEAQLVADATRPTTRKVRFVSEHFSTHLLRADWEFAQPAAADVEQQLIERTLAVLPRADVVVLSDYAKGVLTRRVIFEVIAAARKLGKPVIVDPKSRDFAIYRGATLLTPNRKELAEATGHRAASDAEIIEAARSAMQSVDCEAIIVTRSEQGMSLVPRSGTPVHVPAYAVKVVRRLRSGRHRRRRARRDACGRRRLRNRAARRQCSRRGRGRQARHGDRHDRGVARAAPAACRARRRRKDRRQPRRTRRACRRPGGDRACASVSPMAASIFCILAISRC